MLQRNTKANEAFFISGPHRTNNPTTATIEKQSSASFHNAIGLVLLDIKPAIVTPGIVPTNVVKK